MKSRNSRKLESKTWLSSIPDSNSSRQESLSILTPFFIFAMWARIQTRYIHLR